MSQTIIKGLKVLALVGLSFSAFSTSYASGGCGHGAHRGYHGRCVMNVGRHYVVAPAPRARYCWHNRFGQLRCQ